MHQQQSTVPISDFVCVPHRFARPSDPAPARYVPPPHDQPPTEPPHPNGGRPGKPLFPGAFSSYNPPPSRGAPPPQRQQGPNQQSHGFMQAYDRRNDRYGVPPQQSGMRAYPNVPAAATGQGVPRHPPAQPPAQQSIAAGLPVLSDSSEDEDDLPLPGSTSMRAMSVLQKYLSGAPGDSFAAAAEAAAAAPQAGASAAAPRGHAMTTTAAYMPHIDTQAAALTDPRAGGQGRALPNRGLPARPLAAPPSGYSSGSDHSQMNGGVMHKKAAAATAAGDGASDDMDMSPIVEHEKGDSLDCKALAKLPAQVLCYYQQTKGAITVLGKGAQGRGGGGGGSAGERNIQTSGALQENQVAIIAACGCFEHTRSSTQKTETT